MSNITFSCPECSATLRTEFEDEGPAVKCDACQTERMLMKPELVDGTMRHCLACPSDELFVRKDFPQRLGVLIIGTGFTISTIFWAYEMVLWSYVPLFVSALIDAVLYLTMGDVLECYRCQAQYRGLPGFDDYKQFDLDAFERHRQQAIRLEEAKQASMQNELRSHADEQAPPTEHSQTAR